MKTQVIDLDAKPAGEAELDDAVFGLPARSDILARMVQWQLAKRRAGTHKVKQRAEVTGSTMKIAKQKGTGRARHGNKKAPQFRTGGVAHGPHVRDHGFDLPKKVRQLALCTALSVKRATGRLVVLNEATAADPKTKALADRFEKLGWTNALIIAGHEVDENFAKAARNIPNIDVLPTAGANVYDILRRDTLVLTLASLDALQARLTAAPEVK